MKHTLIFSALFAITVTSCIKSKDHNASATNPVKRETGTPIGNPVFKSIGPDGGTIMSADNQIQVTIPAGAVSAPTDFSIQQVTNTLEEAGLGSSFRLQPENIHFQKPVTIEFPYGALDLAGTAPEFLYLTYQDKEGYFWLARNTHLDTITKKLSVTTTHFSDWTICEYFQVRIDKNTVPYNGTANLKLVRFDFGENDLPASLTEDIQLPGLVEYKATNGETTDWKLPVGEGTLNSNGANCTYTAPPSEPAENPALISVHLSNIIWNGKANDRLQSGGQLILTTPVYVGSDQYVQYATGGNNYYVTGDCVSGCIYNETTGKFYLKTTMSDNRFLEIKIPAAGGKGVYPYGDTDGTAEIIEGAGFSNNNQRYHTSYLPCIYCNAAFSSGAVSITQFDDNSDNSYVEGSFTATLYLWNGEVNPPNKAITGRFRFKRQ